MTKEQIKEALDAVKDYCHNFKSCDSCNLNDYCPYDQNEPLEYADTEKIAEAVADERS